MRRLIASVLVVTQVTWTAAALAQETVATPSAPPATTTQTTTTATTPSVPPTSTTTTTQAAIDTTPAPVIVPPPTTNTESGGSQTTTYVNRPLLATGLLFFGGTYAAAVGVAAESGRPADKPNLYYPVAGPWIDLAQRDCSPAHPCPGETGNKTLLILDGIGQGAGALAVVTSFFLPEKKSRHWFIIGNETVHASPSTIGSGYGLTAAGKF